MRVVIAGTLLAVLIGAWLGWRAVTPANSMPAPTQLKQANPGAAAVVSEPRPLPPVYRTTGTSHAAPAKHQETKRMAPITLPPPDIASSSAAPEVALLASPAGDSSPISTVLATASVAGPRLDDTKVSQTSGGKLIKKVDPIYPPGIAHDVHGEVVLKATINPRGQVTKISVVRGQPVLARAAITAVMRWRYEPFLLNDVPTEVVNEIVLNFKAPGQ
jgi:TonB family protein